MLWNNQTISKEQNKLNKLGKFKARTIWVTKTNEMLVVVQSLSCVYATPWTAAHQCSLSFTISQSLLKLMSIESVMPSNRLILCCPLLLLPLIFPSNRIFSNELVLPSGGQSIGASATTSVLPMNIHSWFPLGLTGLIFLQSKGLSRIFSNEMLLIYKQRNKINIHKSIII